MLKGIICLYEKTANEKEASGRNRTITLDEKEANYYIEQCIDITSCNSLKEITNRIVFGNSFEVMPILPHNFVDLLVVDPPYNLNKSFGEIFYYAYVRK